MAFDEVQLDPQISYGMKGGPTYSTLVIRTSSGADARHQQWPVAIHQYDVSYNIANRTKLASLLSFYHGRRGRARGFRAKDWNDYSSNPYPSQGGVIQATTQAISTTQFQLIKVYDSQVNPETRTILKPYTTSLCFPSSTWAYPGILVFVGGSQVTSGFTVDYTAGVITFASAPSGIVTWAGEFDVPVRFDTDLMEAVKEDFDIGSWTGIKLVELLYPNA